MESGSATIKIQYKTLGNRVIQHSSAFFRKLNQFSIGQVIQIKYDDVTVGEIVKEFGQVHEDLEKVSHFELLPCLVKPFEYLSIS